MKKYQYAISIWMGVLVGAIIALLVGNTTTAILSGVVSAGFTAWVGSLQWSKAMGLGVVVGRKIHGMREDAKTHPLPSLKLRDQATFHRP